MSKRIFIASANDPEHRLSLLGQEYDRLYNLATQTDYSVHREERATTQSLTNHIIQFMEEIEIFHFSGHAGQNRLMAADQPARAKGIAQLLGMCPNLKLVFLNGCSTHGQVDALLKQGIPIVIATSAPVEDNKAFLYSETFYKQLLTEEATIEEAHDLAVAAVNIVAETPSMDIIIHHPFRSFGFDDEENPTWNLYISDDKYREWSPEQQSKENNRQKRRFKENHKLIKTIFESMNGHSAQVTDKLKNASQNAANISLEQQYNLVFEEMPDIISDHIRKLISPKDENTEGIFYDKIGKDRLRQLLNTFDSLVEFLLFILLSDLWDISKEKQLFPSHKELANTRKFLSLKEKERQNFDLVDVITEIRICIQTMMQKDPSIQFFIKEFTTLSKEFNKGNELYTAFKQIKQIKAFYLKKEKALDDEALYLSSIAVELHLCDIFQHLGFLARYSLFTVTDIDVLKWRHESKAKFRHKMKKPAFAYKVQGIENKDEVMDSFIPNKSIILIRKDDEKLKQFLNLSPFIIDANAFDTKASLPKIHFYHHFEDYGEEDIVCFYKHIYKPQDDLLATDMETEGDDKYSILAKQFDAFSELFFNCKMDTL